MDLPSVFRCCGSEATKCEASSKKLVDLQIWVHGMPNRCHGPMSGISTNSSFPLSGNDWRNCEKNGRGDVGLDVGLSISSPQR